MKTAVFLSVLLLAGPAHAAKNSSSTAPAAKPRTVSPEEAAYAAKKKAFAERLKAAQTPEARAAVLEQWRKDQPARPPKPVLSEDERRNQERAEAERQRAKAEYVRRMAKPQKERVVQEREKGPAKP